MVNHTDVTFPVEAGHVLLFSRAIGGPDSGMPSVAVPPTFVAAASHFVADYPFRPHLGEPWFGSGRRPGQSRDGQGNGMHAEQHYRYHRPIKPGDLLVGTRRPGRSWVKQARSGQLRFSEELTDFHTQDGVLCVESRLVRVRLPLDPTEVS